MGKVAYTRCIAARTIETTDQTKFDRVCTDGEDDGNLIGDCFRRKCRTKPAGRDDDGHLTVDKLGRQFRQSVELILRPAIFDRGCSGAVSAIRLN